jgi:probable F420-dependent oxidoreductase
MTYALGGTGIWEMGLRYGDRGRAAEAATELEELGYSALWIPDAGGDDLFDAFAALLGATRTVTVASGILNLWTQDAGRSAAAYAKLVAEHGERLLIGIGVSHAPIINQMLDGNPFQQPLARMGEFLDALDAAAPPLPVANRVLAALGPKMLGLARDRSAGAHPYLVSPEHTATAREVLGAGRLLAPEQGVVLETDPTRAREIARKNMALYFGLPNYVNNWRRYGFTDDDVTAPGSDRLVDAMVAWGDESAIAERIRQHRDAGADHVCVQVMIDREGMELPQEQWRRLAPALVGS